MQAYPEGVEAPAERYTMDGYGLFEDIVKPPNMTITAYDLNKGTIKWQVPLGDDPRLIAKGILGTGTAGDFKLGVIPTAGGLVFVAGGDDRIRAIDAATGKQVWIVQLGAARRGIPSMYELNGRQYLLMTASGAGHRRQQPAARRSAARIRRVRAARRRNRFVHYVVNRVVNPSTRTRPERFRR